MKLTSEVNVKKDWFNDMSYNFTKMYSIRFHNMSLADCTIVRSNENKNEKTFIRSEADIVRNFLKTTVTLNNFE